MLCCVLCGEKRFKLIQTTTSWEEVERKLFSQNKKREAAKGKRLKDEKKKNEQWRWKNTKREFNFIYLDCITFLLFFFPHSSYTPSQVEPASTTTQDKVVVALGCKKHSREIKQSKITVATAALTDKIIFILTAAVLSAFKLVDWAQRDRITTQVPLQTRKKLLQSWASWKVLLFYFFAMPSKCTPTAA